MQERIAEGRIVDLEGPGETERLARRLALLAGKGDLITLQGDLGAGKTTFARAFIRTRANLPDLTVPSPSFTLAQTYDTGHGPVTHVDFYRLSGPGEAIELGLDDALGEGIVLVEWPENGESPTAASRLDLVFLAADADTRRVEIRPSGGWVARLDRAFAIIAFLETAGLGSARRGPLAGDASSRRYERLVSDGRTMILMDAPATPDPGRPGEIPYSRQVHLAEDVRPFAAMARALKEAGVNAPSILAADYDQGLLLLEDLGGDGIVDQTGDGPVPNADRYAVAIEVLAHLHRQSLPRTLTLADGWSRVLPPFDTTVAGLEARLLIEWFAPYAGIMLEPQAISLFEGTLEAALAPVLVTDRDQTWLLRDYHSPNLLWLGERQGTDRIGVIDFQDALWGPPAYDVASLIYDARVDMPPQLSHELLAHYFSLRETDPEFDQNRFRSDLALMTAQRSCKILGIFVRLSERDGKPGYLRHLTRIASYLDLALAHPVMSPLREWFERHLPAALTGRV